MSVKHIVDSTIPLRDIQRSQVKDLVASTRAQSSEYRNRMIIETWFAEHNPTDSTTEDAIVAESGRKIVSHAFKMISLDGRHRCNSVHQSEAESAHDWTECQLGVIQIISRDFQAIGQAKAIKLSRMANTSMKIVRMDRSVQYVLQAVLNYVDAFQLQYAVSFREARTKDTVDIVMPLQYTCRQLCLSYIRYVRFDCPTKKNSDEL